MMMRSWNTTAAASNATLATTVAAMVVLVGCTAQVRVAGPAYVPPPPVYVPPPPADEADVRVDEAPPPLPEYEQPPCPVDGYLWTPGYWAWSAGGYYWVPGTWVQPPRVGLLWTPGYWGFVGGAYVFHVGYWGPHVGFYGGINYGFGYAGVGFAGGRWAGGSFAYNRSVTNISNVTVVHNTYNETVINNVTINKVSYNGGSGGTVAVPTQQEHLAMQEAHVAPTQLQQQHAAQAASNPALFARANGGHPAIAATPRAAEFHAAGATSARGASPSLAQHEPQQDRGILPSRSNTPVNASNAQRPAGQATPGARAAGAAGPRPAYVANHPQGQQHAKNGKPQSKPKSKQKPTRQKNQQPA